MFSDVSSTYRERMNLKAPIYFSTGLTEKANHYYKLFITWTNQKIRKTFVQRNMFEFKHIKAFDRSYADNPGPMVRSFVPSVRRDAGGGRGRDLHVLFQVVFATPGMLHAGQSLQIFKKWAGNEKNMVSPGGGGGWRCPGNTSGFSRSSCQVTACKEPSDTRS